MLKECKDCGEKDGEGRLENQIRECDRMCQTALYMGHAGPSGRTARRYFETHSGTRSVGATHTEYVFERVSRGPLFKGYSNWAVENETAASCAYGEIKRAPVQWPQDCGVSDMKIEM